MADRDPDAKTVPDQGGPPDPPVLPRREAPSIGIRNLSGVPVLDVLGELNSVTLRAVEEVARRLVRAGHCQFVLNIQNAALAFPKAFTRPLQDAAGRALRGLPAPLVKLADEARRHHGSVMLVARAEQAAAGIADTLGGSLRICRSEAEALLRIKGGGQLPSGALLGTSAKLAD